MEMKRIFLILSLMVSLGTLAQSQIVLNAPQARTIIAKLDSLDYLRDGYAIQDSLLTLSQREVYNRQLAVDARDSMIVKLQATNAGTREDLRKAEKKAKFWKYVSFGLSISTITAIIIEALK